MVHVGRLMALVVACCALSCTSQESASFCATGAARQPSKSSSNTLSTVLAQPWLPFKKRAQRAEL